MNVFGIEVSKEQLVSGAIGAGVASLVVGIPAYFLGHRGGKSSAEKLLQQQSDAAEKAADALVK